MFSKFSLVLAASAMIAGVVAKPLPQVRALAARTDSSSHGSSISFNNWMGISSLDGFDNFYGSDNFRGSIQKQVIIEQDQQLVCHSQSVEIIQQRLLVIQEMAKRIISEQICEVETQTIVFEQFHSSLGSFGHDIRRKSSNSVGYDRGISSHYSNIMNSDGSLSSNDLGFHGSDLGSQYAVPTGNNWNDQSSPSKVDAAFNATRDARGSSNSTAPSS
ncbi:hypothetical protein GALMADRAFT_112932 [Galerina marginata CBS 339.88]|uniref:Uncharacterized protein n=1 Tax=Galerina marginata (strain CBS 339.88) TaxID=685588 RepID=A0A067TV20_GALM3|nr:hypothetical protein GALMADRAFT_112932 [Galerina marginata CBS 339.88]